MATKKVGGMIALPCTDLESEIGHIKYNVKEVGYVLSLKEPQTTPQSLVEKTHPVIKQMLLLIVQPNLALMH